MTKIYQVVLKRKDNDYEEVVGQSFEREEALKARDHYNEHKITHQSIILCLLWLFPKLRRNVDVKPLMGL